MRFLIALCLVAAASGSVLRPAFPQDSILRPAFPEESHGIHEIALPAEASPLVQIIVNVQKKSEQSSPVAEVPHFGPPAPVEEVPEFGPPAAIEEVPEFGPPAAIEEVPEFGPPAAIEEVPEFGPPAAIEEVPETPVIVPEFQPEVPIVPLVPIVPDERPDFGFFPANPDLNRPSLPGANPELLRPSVGVNSLLRPAIYYN